MILKKTMAAAFTLAYVTGAQADNIVQDWEEHIPDYHGIYEETDIYELRSIQNQSFTDQKVAEHGINFSRIECIARKPENHSDTAKPVEIVVSSATPEGFEDLYGAIRGQIEFQDTPGYANYVVLDKDGNVTPLDTVTAMDDFMNAIRHGKDHRGTQKDQLDKLKSYAMDLCLNIS